jgi:hypothetical protein
LERERNGRAVEDGNIITREQRRGEKESKQREQKSCRRNSKAKA